MNALRVAVRVVQKACISVRTADPDGFAIEDIPSIIYHPAIVCSRYIVWEVAALAITGRTYSWRVETEAVVV